MFSIFSNNDLILWKWEIAKWNTFNILLSFQQIGLTVIFVATFKFFTPNMYWLDWKKDKRLKYE